MGRLGRAGSGPGDVPRGFHTWHGRCNSSARIAAGATGPEGRPRRIRDSGDDAGVIDLSDLRDGETRTFGSGEHAIDVTREGDVIRITLPRGDGDDAKVIDCKLGGSGGCYAFSTDHTVGVKMIVVDGDDDGAIKRKIEVIKIGEDGGNVFHHRDANVLAWSTAGDGDLDVLAAAHVLHLGDGKRVLRCPEGDTTMRLEKDDDRTFYCPQHNVELDEVEIERIMKRIVIDTDEDEEVH
jgi:hypothetical protein